MNAIRFIIYISLSAASVSCVSTVHTVNRYGIKVTLIDAENRKPLVRTETRIEIDGVAFVKSSDRRGRLSVEADRQLRLTWLGGPAWWSDRDATIAIQPDGYDARTIDGLRMISSDSPGAETRRFRERAGVIELGKLEMKKR
jgi:hypothetical protein